MDSFLFRIGKLGFARFQNSSMYGWRLLFWRFWWKDDAFWRELAERNRQDEAARYHNHDAFR
jgi:hypothetical protein